MRSYDYEGFFIWEEGLLHLCEVQGEERDK